MHDVPALLFILANLSGPTAHAGDARIDIISPANFARVDAQAQNKIDYEITLGGKGNHAHVYVDGKQTALLHEMKGSYDLGPLAQDKHKICIKMVDKDHTPTGVESCVTVVAQ